MESSSNFLTIQNKMSPNNAILFNRILRPILPSHAFASCSFINLFFLLHIALDNNIVLLFLVYNSFEFTLCFFVVVVVVFLFCFFLLQTICQHVYKDYYMNSLRILFQLVFLLGFCFKNLDLSDIKLEHLDASLVTLLFVINY